MGLESLMLPDKKDIPKPGLYRVAGINSVIQAGGLAMRDYIEDKNEAGEQMISDKVVRIPVGTQLKVEKFIHSNRRDAVYGVVSYEYYNPNKGKTLTLRGCVDLGMLEKVDPSNPTAAALLDLKKEMEGS